MSPCDLSSIKTKVVSVTVKEADHEDVGEVRDSSTRLTQVFMPVMTSLFRTGGNAGELSTQGIMLFQ